MTAQETTMTAPAFEPYDELDQDAHDYLTKHVADQPAWQLVQRLNADRLTRADNQNALRTSLAVAQQEKLTGYERGHADGQANGLPLWLGSVFDAARALARGDEQYRAVTTDRGTRVFLLTEAELDRQTGVVDAKVHEADCCGAPVGSAAWLRDLADRLQKHLGDRLILPDEVAEQTMTTPAVIRLEADEAECDERAEREAAAADTRDRERVEKIVVRQLVESTNAAAERLAEMVGAHATSAFSANEFDARAFWDGLPAETREKALAPALELYRAGRDDQEAR